MGRLGEVKTDFVAVAQTGAGRIGRAALQAVPRSVPVTAIESAVRAPKSVYDAIVKEGGNTKRAVRDVLSLLGLLSGYPAGAVARPAGYLADISEGKADPESQLDFARGLVSGRTPSR